MDGPTSRPVDPGGVSVPGFLGLDVRRGGHVTVGTPDHDPEVSSRTTSRYRVDIGIDFQFQ